MSYMIKRTTGEKGSEVVRYFMRFTAFGPMFQTEDLAKSFDSAEDAQKLILEEGLDELSGTLEIIEIV